MPFTKLLKMLLGFAGLFNMGIVEDGGGGSTEPLTALSAADAFSSLLGDDDQAGSESQDDDTPEAAAERLAKHELSGGEDDQASDKDATDPAPDDGAITVEIDGKMVTLTKAQIVENHLGGMRDKDYRQKTMAAAEERKSAEVEKTAARQERDSYGQKLNHFAISQQAAIQEQEALLTDELFANDLPEYLAIERTVRQRQANLAQAQQELQTIGQQQQTEQAQAHQQFLVEQHQTLLEKLPEWKDPAKMKAGLDALDTYLTDRGFNAGDGKTVLDARVMLLANDAMKYRDLMDRAGKAVKKVATVPVKAERSGSAEVASPDRRTEALKRVGKSGSINDAANAFNQFS